MFLSNRKKKKIRLRLELKKENKKKTIAMILRFRDKGATTIDERLTSSRMRNL